MAAEGAPGPRGFDVVVVGGGSAGCALAGRLVAAGLRVGLVEAGPDYGPRDSERWPPELLDPRVRPRSHDWGYVAQGWEGGLEPVPRAKVIGGCSAHNQCAAVWGLPRDYDRWGAAGTRGWSYARLRPLIDLVERAPDGSADCRGRFGAMPTRPYAEGELASWQRWFMESAVASGFPRIADLSAPEPAEGVAPFHANVDGLVRWNGAFAFLDPVRPRKNLTVLAETLADRLVLRGGRAAELVCHAGRETITLAAERFVLAAGAYGSPAILLRSGIGRAMRLEDLGIPVALDLRGVGENLHDHPGVALRLEPSERGRRALTDDLGGGRFFQSQVILRARSAGCAEAFDLHVLPYQARTELGEWRYELLVFDMAPRSRGRVRLTGRDPLLAPAIDFRFLTDPDDHDLAVLREGLEVARRVAGAAPLAAAIGGEAAPSARHLETYLRSTVGGYAHPVGTCKMGPVSDVRAVVDGSGRVHGTENVHVADASVIPEIPRANTNLTCCLVGLAVAERLLAAGSR